MEERQSTYENGFFKATFNLLPGYYTITAYSEMLTDLGDNENSIDDNKIYAPVTESNIIYISPIHLKLENNAPTWKFYCGLNYQKNALY